MKLIIRCNHCGKSHLEDYCFETGKVPSQECIEDDIDPTPFNEETFRKWQVSLNTPKK